MKRALTGGKLILPEGIAQKALVFENGVICEIADEPPNGCEIIDVGGEYVSPGFVDCHCHGGGGYDFLDGTAEAFEKAATAHMLHGTTCLLATLTTCGDREFSAALSAYESAVKGALIPTVFGLHLEGPYFAREFAGAQDPKHIILPDPKHYLAILDACNDIRRVSAACELPGALQLGDELKKRGILASIAHSAATYREVEQAIEHGFSHVTHLYCAMSTIKRVNAYRVLGVTESAYLFDELAVEIIADGRHLPIELIRLVLRGKPHGKIMLVTDAMRGAGVEGATGMRIGNRETGMLTVIEDGVAKLPDRSCFAGSVCTADRCVRTMLEAGLSLNEAVAMMTRNPCDIQGIPNKGRLEPGCDADIITFGENVAIDKVFAGGKLLANNGLPVN